MMSSKLESFNLFVFKNRYQYSVIKINYLTFSFTILIAIRLKIKQIISMYSFK